MAQYGSSHGGAPGYPGPQQGPAPVSPGPAGSSGKPPAWLWIGMGCAALLVLGSATIGLAWYLTGGSETSKTEDDPQATVQTAAPIVAVPDLGGAGRPMRANPDPPKVVVETADDTCVKAETCCRAMVAKLPRDPKTLAACSDVRKLPKSRCGQMFDSYQQAARSLGVHCN